MSHHIIGSEAGHAPPWPGMVRRYTPRTRRSLWHIAVQAWAALTFIAVAVVAFTIIGGR